jgi:hypothetical protein
MEGTRTLNVGTACSLKEHGRIHVKWRYGNNEAQNVIGVMVSNPSGVAENCGESKHGVTNQQSPSKRQR